ncbi:hypothetical protein [Actinokineospora sp. HUAS TT18]|uniref:hypothetical protein n=1 Tax=Actinokineospora sp. HUAS TT18 TaxID=3447451 RepID=UPI003F520A79
MPVSQTGKRLQKEMAPAMNIAAKIRARRVEARTRKAVNRAIENAATPSMRHELIALAQIHSMR